ncbi:MAG: hypothetical protein LZF62_40009 [Nitrospira sp.]|nr:MAG: hypothetical protein LZF62_40009 [Nitrospira sp.]
MEGKPPTATLRISQLHLWVYLLLVAGTMFVSKVSAVEPLDRVRDGFVGSVKTVMSKSGAITTVKNYDPSGALTKIQTHRAPPTDQPEIGPSLEETVYKYDALGNLTSEIIEDDTIGQYPSKLYAYDKGGTRVAEAAYNVCGTFSSLHIYEHDDKERLRQALLYKSRSLTRTVLDYDEQGRLIKRRLYQNGVFKSITQYAYDLNHHVAEQITYLPNGALYSDTRYAYDDRGNTVVEECRHPTLPSLDSKEISTYEYDSVGNWTKRTIHREIVPIDEDGKPVSESMEVIERSITYH